LPLDPESASQAFVVELQWQLFDTPFFFKRIPTEGLFKRAQPLQVTGVDVHALSAEDQVLHACGHLALHHNYDTALFRYYEMASVILQAGSAFDWDAVAARAVAWRLVLPVQRVLSRLATIWSGIVPVQALETMLALQPTTPERWVHGWLVKERDNLALKVVLSWLTLPGLGRRWRFLLETTFPSRAFLEQRYGPAPGGVWPLLHLRRVAAAIKYLVR
jgi:hypothetical protein